MIFFYITFTSFFLPSNIAIRFTVQTVMLQVLYMYIEHSCTGKQSESTEGQVILGF